jgi:hypothetical protein
MDLADYLMRLARLDTQLSAEGSADDPLERLRRKLTEAGLIEYDDDAEPWIEVPEVWGIRKVEEWRGVVQEVVCDTEDPIEAEGERIAALEAAALDVVAEARKLTAEKRMPPTPREVSRGRSGTRLTRKRSGGTGCMRICGGQRPGPGSDSV